MKIDTPFILYSHLECSKNASEKELEDAFSLLAKQFHPDKNGGDDRRFKEINTAFQILDNPSEKKRYDEMCFQRLALASERRVQEALKEKQSAVYKAKNPYNIKQNISKWLNEHLIKQFSEIWSEDLTTQMNTDIEKSVESLGIKFLNHPFQDEFKSLQKLNKLVKKGNCSERWCRRVLSKYGMLKSSKDVSFWQKKLDSIELEKKESISKDLTDEVQSSPYDKIMGQFLGAQGQEYDKMLLNWILEQIELEQQAIYQKYKKIAENLRQIQNSLDIFRRFGWDLSLGQLSAQNIKYLMEWSKYFHENENIQKLCDLLGRLVSEKTKHEKREIFETVSYESVVVDHFAKEEFSGITLGNTIADVLPQELALLANEETSILFDLKFVEKKLMCFEKIGYASESKEKQQKKEEDKEIKECKGPIIFCIDTSGSMAGLPENIAKAIVLSMVPQAQKQNRKSYLINFSTNIEVMDCSEKKSLNDLIDFLKMSFHGGTDVMPALEKTLEVMEDGNFEKADVLVISDFVFSTKNREMNEKISNQKEKGSRFYALSVCDYSAESLETQSIFDEVWTYSSKESDIKKLFETMKQATKIIY